jgi:hypothetical protein
MLHMPQSELDDLFRSSPAGDIPQGEGQGTIVVDPDTRFAQVAAKVVHLIAWQGKIFDPVKGELLNEVSPLHLDRIRAKVYMAESWFDGKECIVLDYSKTSLVAHWIRDEMREVSPGVYLGIVFWDEKLLFNFALDFNKPLDSGGSKG